MKQSSTPQLSFRSAGWLAGTLFSPPGTETLAPRQMKRGGGGERSISTYDMKIQKHQRKLSKKSTSSKTEVALLSLHSMLKWFSVQCVLTKKQNKTAHLTDRYSMMMDKLNMKYNRSKKE